MKNISILTSAAVLLFAISSIAADRVVVVPIGSGIKSSKETVISVSPLTITPIISFNLTRNSYPYDGYLQLNSSSIEDESILFPVTLPSTIFGVNYKLKSIEICYQMSSSSSRINSVKVSYFEKTGVKNTIIDDGTDRSSISWECSTITDPTPELINGPMLIDMFTSFDSGSLSMKIGTINLTLVE